MQSFDQKDYVGFYYTITFGNYDICMRVPTRWMRLKTDKGLQFHSFCAATILKIHQSQVSERDEKTASSF